MSDKIWQSQSAVPLHAAVEAYTVGDDYMFDQRLLGYDIKASKAHAKMLASVDLLTAAECAELVKALDALQRLWEKGEFVITQDQEDGHTAIEAYLVEKLGAVGKKIHTARSRNDQALVMVRLYLKDSLQKVSVEVAKTAAIFRKAASRAGDTPMPGYTHMQRAMPTTIACWLESYADGFDDARRLVESSRQIIDQNPLGSAAGFGVDLPVNREHTTKTLGFHKTQQNPMYCGLSRGLFELIAVQALSPVMVLAGKFAWDIMLSTTQEFDLVSLPESFTTGSSIMPHKHNYDLFEIMRGNNHIFGSYSQHIQSLTAGTGSGYHRDLQLTKGVTMKAFDTTLETLQVLSLAIANLRLHKEELSAAITPEMYSVVEINKLVDQGLPFRDAYMQVKGKLSKDKKA